MRISFVLPGYLEYPVGGTKIIYEYANRLAERGHEINLIHPYRRHVERAPLESLKNVLRRAKTRRRTFWFPLRSDVRSLLVADHREKFVPPADVIFATAWDTAPHVYRYHQDKGEKFYLIQHHETWDGPEEEIDDTWRLPMKKIVIAKWLRDLSISFGEAERTFYVPNGLDFSQLKVTSPIENRKPHILMLNHLWPWKGTLEGLAALEIVHRAYPECRATLFGVSGRGDHIPTWIDYVQAPSRQQLLELYNDCSIFVHTSRKEGWGLTPAEAMACGCAVVATENEGVQEYARHQINALLVAIQQPESIAQGIITFLKDEPLRTRMATQGQQDIQEFTWERAVAALEKILTER